MKRFFIYIILIITSLSALGQEIKPAGEEQKREMMEKIAQASASMKTIQCDFEQTKHLSFLDEKMVSKGSMYYKQDSLLRWEYKSPYSYILILNGTHVVLESSNKKEVMDIKSNRLFQEIAKIMMNSVTGKSLSENNDFKATLYIQGDKWLAKLIPQKREIKQMFSNITLYFDSQKSTIYHVELLEKTGDITHIELKNIRLNTTIDEKVFDFK
ncbi:outer membrane lipoprotein carrier protein LolA [Odoribacter sp. OttesenSCG-928-J03]|nr:outer membrane lipoprotein carrier protein LolA [Odoribacter sp. OttesenSCG-928-J03]MDL2331241.1 outer membrane lipoprotein carrier protein LolA [Odoribacter sp. OttesenSCG-928-A06]